MVSKVQDSIAARMLEAQAQAAQTSSQPPAGGPPAPAAAVGVAPPMGQTGVAPLQPKGESADVYEQARQIDKYAIGGQQPSTQAQPLEPAVVNVTRPVVSGSGLTAQVSMDDALANVEVGGIPKTSTQQHTQVVAPPPGLGSGRLGYLAEGAIFGQAILPGGPGDKAGKMPGLDPGFADGLQVGGGPNVGHLPGGGLTKEDGLIGGGGPEQGNFDPSQFHPDQGLGSAENPGGGGSVGPDIVGLPGDQASSGGTYDAIKAAACLTLTGGNLLATAVCVAGLKEQDEMLEKMNDYAKAKENNEKADGNKDDGGSDKVDDSDNSGDPPPDTEDQCDPDGTNERFVLRGSSLGGPVGVTAGTFTPGPHGEDDGEGRLPGRVGQDNQVNPWSPDGDPNPVDGLGWSGGTLYPSNYSNPTDNPLFVKSKEGPFAIPDPDAGAV
ncbi:MAG: hypothetical protein HYV63_03280 [Candidatus Schekmanbacteria bacterium]|nr:hypothetical protein [Candidatus Schekmanbacteria bacterium]